MATTPVFLAGESSWAEEPGSPQGRKQPETIEATLHTCILNRSICEMLSDGSFSFSSHVLSKLFNVSCCFPVS